MIHSTSTPNFSSQPTVSRQRSSSDRHIRPSASSLSPMHNTNSNEATTRQRSISGQQQNDQFRTYYNSSNPTYRRHPTNLLEQQQQHLQLLQPSRTIPFSALTPEEQEQFQQQQHLYTRGGSDQVPAQQQLHQSSQISTLSQQSQSSDLSLLVQPPAQHHTSSTKSDLLSLSLPTRKLSSSQFIRMARQASDSAFRTVRLTKKSSDNNLNGSAKKTLISLKSNKDKSDHREERNGDDCVYEQNPRGYLFQQLPQPQPQPAKPTEQPQNQPPPRRPTRPRSHETIPDEWTLHFQQVAGFEYDQEVSRTTAMAQPTLQEQRYCQPPKKPFGELRKNCSLPDLKAASAATSLVSLPLAIQPVNTMRPHTRTESSCSFSLGESSSTGASHTISGAGAQNLRHSRNQSRPRVQPHHFISNSSSSVSNESAPSSLMNQLSLTTTQLPSCISESPESDSSISPPSSASPRDHTDHHAHHHNLPERARSPPLQKRSPSRANSTRVNKNSSHPQQLQRKDSHTDDGSAQRERFLTRHQILSDESLPDYSNALHPIDTNIHTTTTTTNSVSNASFVLESAAAIVAPDRHEKELPPTPTGRCSPPPPPFPHLPGSTTTSPARLIRRRKESNDFIGGHPASSPMTTITAAAMMSPSKSSIAIDTSSVHSNAHLHGSQITSPVSESTTSSTNGSPLRRKGSKHTGVIPQDVHRAMDPIQVQKCVSECVKTSRVYKVMDADQLAELKKEQDDLQLLIETLNVSLHIEHRIREASVSLIRLHESSCNKIAVLEATSQFQSTTKKMDQLSQRIHQSWSRLMVVQRSLLQHESAVLNAGLRRLDGENRDLSRQVLQVEKAKEEEREEKMKCKKENYRLKVQSILFSAGTMPPPRQLSPILGSPSTLSVITAPQPQQQQQKSEPQPQQPTSAESKLEEMEKYVKELSDEILQKDEKLSCIQEQLRQVQKWSSSFQSSIYTSISSSKSSHHPGDDNDKSHDQEDMDTDQDVPLQGKLSRLQSTVEGHVKSLELRVQDLLLQTRILSQDQNQKSDRDSKRRSGSPSPAARLSDQIRLSKLLQQQQQHNNSEESSSLSSTYTPTKRSSWRANNGNPHRGSADLRKVLRESLLELDRRLELDESLTSASASASSLSLSQSPTSTTSRPSSTSTVTTAFSAAEPLELNSTSPSLSRRSSGSSTTRSSHNSLINSINRSGLSEQVVLEEEHSSSGDDEDEDEVHCKKISGESSKNKVVEDAQREILRLLAMVQKLEGVVHQAQKIETN